MAVDIVRGSQSWMNEPLVNHACCSIVRSVRTTVVAIRQHPLFFCGCPLRRWRNRCCCIGLYVVGHVPDTHRRSVHGRSCDQNNSRDGRGEPEPARSAPGHGTAATLRYGMHVDHKWMMVMGDGRCLWAAVGGSGLSTSMSGCACVLRGARERRKL
eukprot:scaffold8459_cov121-Isochrysis_galbana.AAC.6